MLPWYSTLIELIHGDALEVLPTLQQYSFDLVIADPPAELSDEDSIRALVMMKQAARNDANLFYYGVTPGKLIRACVAGGWHPTGLFALNLKKEHVGYVVRSTVYGARGPKSKHEDFFGSSRKDLDIPVSEPKGIEEHPTTKPASWFSWIFCQPWERVLDPFAGLSPVGSACKTLGIDYVGVELDEQIYKEAQNRLAR